MGKHSKRSARVPGIGVTEALELINNECDRTTITLALESKRLAGVWVGGSVGWRIDPGNVKPWWTEAKRLIALAVKTGDAESLRRLTGLEPSHPKGA